MYGNALAGCLPVHVLGLTLAHIYILQRKDSEIHTRGVCCDPVFELDHSVAWLDIPVWYMNPFSSVCTFNTV